MKQLLFLITWAIAASAYAQASKEPAKPAPQASTTPAPAKEAAKPPAEPAKQATVAKKPRRWHEDARHCLERVSNTEIIKCAEEFL